MKLFIALLIFTTLAFAQNNDVTHRPKSFMYENNLAVFVDFEEATYDISYDIDAKKAEVVASLRFNMIEEGFPIFDLIQEPTSVKIDGEAVTTSAIQTPNRETTVRVIQKKLSPGPYVLDIKVPLSTLVEYVDGGVKNAFWVTDLEDRFYLERYIPVNFEYDRVKMVFNISFKGLKAKQHLFTNGSVAWLNENQAKIEFPEYYTVNSLYFHTTPEESVKLLQYNLKSIDGRDLPVSIYTANSSSAQILLLRYQDKVNQVVAELEEDYGSFPHSSITIYNANLSHMGLGGMEYAGATVTNLNSVSHELFHSYFARGVAPANGNAGWIDEALAKWRDNGYGRRTSFSGNSPMASGPYYTRKTDTAAYSFGANFMSYLDGVFAPKGGLKPFLNKLLDTKMFTPIFTEDFISEMEKFYGEQVDKIFKDHVYKKMKQKNNFKTDHPIHKKIGIKQLQQIL